MILKAKLKFWNLFFLGPKSQNDKVSVLIGNIILEVFKTHLLFIPIAFFVGVAAI